MVDKDNRRPLLRMRPFLDKYIAPAAKLDGIASILQSIALLLACGLIGVMAGFIMTALLGAELPKGTDSLLGSFFGAAISISGAVVLFHIQERRKSAQGAAVIATFLRAALSATTYTLDQLQIFSAEEASEPQTFRGEMIILLPRIQKALKKIQSHSHVLPMINRDHMVAVEKSEICLEEIEHTYHQIIRYLNKSTYIEVKALPNGTDFGNGVADLVNWRNKLSDLINVLNGHKTLAEVEEAAQEEVRPLVESIAHRTAAAKAKAKVFAR